MSIAAQQHLQHTMLTTPAAESELQLLLGETSSSHTTSTSISTKTVVKRTVKKKSTKVECLDDETIADEADVAVRKVRKVPKKTKAKAARPDEADADADGLIDVQATDAAAERTNGDAETQLAPDKPKTPKKAKKSKKLSDTSKENISVKSSFSKFDALQKKCSDNTFLHVRSSDAGKAQEKFNGLSTGETERNCRTCQKPVYKMEEMKAERSIWHRNCFKCSECGKQLNVDTYESHESILYCKPHFRALFTPKTVEDSEPVVPRKPELIIRENQPAELPPDVVRSSRKADLGLDELLPQLDVRSRYRAFEQGDVHNAGHDRTVSQSDTAADELLQLRAVRRSASVNATLARFQATASDDEPETSADEAQRTGDDVELVRARRLAPHVPLAIAACGNMTEVRQRFETGIEQQRDERRVECKQELQNIRSRLFRGQQAKIKERYQAAVERSEAGCRADREPLDELADKARQMKERFERPETVAEPPSALTVDAAVFEQGIGRQSRTLFMELAAAVDGAGVPPALQRSVQRSTAVRAAVRAPAAAKAPPAEDVVRADDRPDAVRIETADISNKFKFFETYRPVAGERSPFRITPPRDGVVRLPEPDADAPLDCEAPGDPVLLQQSHTTTRMLSMFRELEERRPAERTPKPLKCFTPPPPEPNGDRTDRSDSEDVTDSDSYDEEEDERVLNGSYVRSSDRRVDEFLEQATSAARAKQLRAKFERWETREIAREREERERGGGRNGCDKYDGGEGALEANGESEQSQVETAREIRAKFESMRDQPTFAESREKIKVNRFL